MPHELRARLRPRNHTIDFPTDSPVLPPAFRGRPVLDPTAPPAAVAAAVRTCPTGALELREGAPALDLGRCTFCGECAAGAHPVVRFTREHRLAVRARPDLVVVGEEYRLAAALDADSRRLFGRSLRLRQVSAGGSGAEEADSNVLTTIVFDLARFGVDFVASPRHADGLLVTGPVSTNMRGALLRTWNAVPSPRLVIAVGTSAISGGPWQGHAEVAGGVDQVLPVDLYVPGFPPHPLTILDGILRLLGRAGSI